ncbi:MAG: hypothetical protein NT049_13200 [Planctomycetota bacterium]|nr:hypothetical protein [Planctomycetota bacterium]
MTRTLLAGLAPIGLIAVVAWSAISAAEPATGKPPPAAVAATPAAPTPPATGQDAVDYSKPIPCVHTMLGHNDTVYRVAFSPNGAQAASSGQVAGRELSRIEGPSMQQVHCMAFLPGNDTLASGWCDGVIRLFSLATGKELSRLEKHGPRCIEAMAASPDRALLVTVGRDRRACLWDTATGRPVADTGSLYASPVTVGFLDASRILLVTNDHNISIWEWKSGAVTKWLQEPLLSGVALSPQGNQFVVLGLSDLEQWDAAAGKCLRTAYAGSQSLHGAAISPDGRYLLTAEGGIQVKQPGGTFDFRTTDANFVRLWDLRGPAMPKAP